MQSVGDLTGSGDDGVGLLRCEQAEILVHLCAGALQQAERPDLGALQPPAGDREVLHRPLRLRAPERGDRHPDLAHGVVLDAVLDVCVGGRLDAHVCPSCIGGYGSG